MTSRNPATTTTSNDRDFRGQLSKFRLDSIVSSGSAASSRSSPGRPSAALPPAPRSPAQWQTPPQQLHRIRTSSGDNDDTDDNDKISPGKGTTTPLSNRSKRVSTACDFCRKRKKKCDFRYPNCSACTRAGVRCTVPPPGPQVANCASSVPRDRLETLQNRVTWLEEVFQKRTGVGIADVPTGSNVAVGEGNGDGQGQVHDQNADWWYQVPVLVADHDHSHEAPVLSPLGGRTTSSTIRTTAHPEIPGRHTQTPAAIGTELPNIGEIFRDQLEHRRRSAGRRPSETPTPCILRVSSVAEAEQIASEYFESIGYQYPFLHRGDFTRDLHQIYRGAKPTPAMHYLHHITMATALLIGPSDEAKSVEFYRRSQQTLPLVLQDEDVTAVKALLGLALYTMFATSGPSVWHILGTALRLATSLGLHKTRSFTSLAEEEMMKRTFWSLYSLDRLIASTLNRPLGIADDDISIGLPREFNDDWSEAPGASTVTIPLQLVRLRRIFSRIYRYLYSNRPKPTHGEIAATLGQFRRELDDWRIAAPVIPSALLYSTSYYDYLYYTTLLLMYRPSPRNPSPDVASIVTCGDSSIQVIRSYWDSYSLGKIKWTWLTLSQSYFAGITILWCLERNAQAMRDGHPPLWQPDEQMMRRGIQAVVLLLEEFGHRRAGVERLAETYRQQSTITLSRLVSQQHQQHQQQDQPEQHQHQHQQQDHSAFPHLPPLHHTSSSALAATTTRSQMSPSPPPVSTQSTAPELDQVRLGNHHINNDAGSVPVGGGGGELPLTEQLFYSYDWFQEEMASYYSL